MDCQIASLALQIIIGILKVIIYYPFKQKKLKVIVLFFSTLRLLFIFLKLGAFLEIVSSLLLQVQFIYLILYQQQLHKQTLVLEQRIKIQLQELGQFRISSEQQIYNQRSKILSINNKVNNFQQSIEINLKDYILQFYNLNTISGSNQLQLNINKTLNHKQAYMISDLVYNITQPYNIQYTQLFQTYIFIIVMSNKFLYQIFENDRLNTHRSKSTHQSNDQKDDCIVATLSQNLQSKKSQKKAETLNLRQQTLPQCYQIRQFLKNQKLRPFRDTILSTHQNGFFTPMIKQKIPFRQKRFGQIQEQKRKQKQKEQISTIKIQKFKNFVFDESQITTQKKNYTIKTKSRASTYRKLSQKKSSSNQKKINKKLTSQILIQTQKYQFPSQSSIVFGDRCIIKQRNESKDSDKYLNFYNLYQSKLNKQTYRKTKKQNEPRFFKENVIDIKPWQISNQEN